jgi:hypothetical protein
LHDFAQFFFIQFEFDRHSPRAAQGSQSASPRTFLHTGHALHALAQFFFIQLALFLHSPVASQPSHLLSPDLLGHLAAPGLAPPFFFGFSGRKKIVLSEENLR